MSAAQRGVATDEFERYALELAAERPVRWPARFGAQRARSSRAWTKRASGTAIRSGARRVFKVGPEGPEA